MKKYYINQVRTIQQKDYVEIMNQFSQTSLYQYCESFRHSYDHARQLPYSFKVMLLVNIAGYNKARELNKRKFNT